MASPVRCEVEAPLPEHIRGRDPASGLEEALPVVEVFENLNEIQTKEILDRFTILGIARFENVAVAVVAS